MDIERAKQADRAWQDWTGVNVRRPGPFWLVWVMLVAAILGGASLLGRLGIPLKAGEVILSGALAAMFPAKAGDNFRVTIGGLGGCSVRFH